MVEKGFLQKISLFAELDDRQANLLHGLLKEVKLQPGDQLIEEGKAGNNLFMMCEGKVRILREFDNQTFVLAELGPYDFFGEMALIDDSPASATVEATM